jgi:hypothetical protein
MKLHEVIEQVIKGKGSVYGLANGDGIRHGDSFEIRYSDGFLDGANGECGLSKIVFWTKTLKHPDGFSVSFVPIDLDWKVLVKD